LLRPFVFESFTHVECVFSLCVDKIQDELQSFKEPAATILWFGRLFGQARALPHQKSKRKGWFLRQEQALSYINGFKEAAVFAVLLKLLKVK